MSESTKASESTSKGKFTFHAKAFGRSLLTGLGYVYRWVLRPIGRALSWPVRMIGYGIAWCFVWLRKPWDKATFTKGITRIYVSRPMRWLRMLIFVLTCILFWVMLDVLFFLGPTIQYVAIPITNAMLNSEISVETLKIQPLCGYVQIDNFVVPNSKDFKGSNEIYTEEPLFKLGHFHVDMDVWSLFSDTITINDVEVRDCSALYAWDLDSNNVTSLLVQMGLQAAEADEAQEEATDAVAEAKEEPAPAAEPAPQETAEASASEEKAQKHLLIKHLKLSNNEVTLRYNTHCIVSFNSFLDIELTDATEVDLQEKVLRAKLGPVYDAYVFCSENLSKGYDFLASGAKAIYDGAAKMVGAAVDAISTGAGAAVDAVSTGFGAAVDGVKGLFGGSGDENEK